MINFRLKRFENIVPVGQEPNLYLNWYWLTDGEMWLTFGSNTIFEYSKEALIHFSGKLTPYNDYYLVQFLDDFSDLFEMISESLPNMFYDLTKDLDQFFSHTQKWLDIYDIDEEDYPDFYYEEYDKILSWRNARTFDSIHLIGGPSLSFFRRKDKIRISWQTEHILDNGINLWTARNGSFEMNYQDFVNEVESFGESFFKSMESQLELAIQKEWNNIKVDKQELIREHEIRKRDFYNKFAFLMQKDNEKTNWNEIEKLINRMRSEVK